MKPHLNPSATTSLSHGGGEPNTLRFIEILKTALDKLEGNKNALKTAINRANDNAGSNLHITYEKLCKLVDDDGSVGLTQQDILALHHYLKTLGEGLDKQPVLDKVGILSRLVECRQLSVFFGAYPNVPAARNDVSLWDTRAHSVLVKEVGNLSQQVRISTQDVLWTDDHPKLCRDVETSIGQLDRDCFSVISIGTPRACMATEVILSAAFNFPPRTKSTPSAEWNPPFAFIWPPKLRRGIRSSFALTGDDLSKLDFSTIGRRVEDGQSSALKIGDEVFETPLTNSRSKWTMYGVVVAQRRARGNVWLVVSGISGPATYASALKASEMTATLPFVAKSNGPVLWAAVKAVVSIDKDAPGLGDRRVVDSYDLFRGPYIWPGV